MEEAYGFKGLTGGVSTPTVSRNGMVRLCEVQKSERFIARQASELAGTCIRARIRQADFYLDDGARTPMHSFSARSANLSNENTFFMCPLDLPDDDAHRLHAAILRRHQMRGDRICLGDRAYIHRGPR